LHFVWLQFPTPSPAFPEKFFRWCQMWDFCDVPSIRNMMGGGGISACTNFFFGCLLAICWNFFA
jgi:hypothetical protein